MNDEPRASWDNALDLLLRWHEERRPEVGRAVLQLNLRSAHPGPTDTGNNSGAGGLPEAGKSVAYVLGVADLREPWLALRNRPSDCMCRTLSESLRRRHEARLARQSCQA